MTGPAPDLGPPLPDNVDADEIIGGWSDVRVERPAPFGALEPPRTWTLEELMVAPERLQTPAATIPRLVWPERVTLLAAREKLGKSTLAAAGAAAASDGAPFLGGRCVRSTVLWVCLEEHPADLVRRQLALRTDPERFHVTFECPTIDALDALVERHRPDVLVVDTLVKIVELDAPEAGSSAQWTPLMSRFSRMARERGCGVLLIHHGNKSDGSYRDSTAIGASVDVVLEMREDKQREGVRYVSSRGRVWAPDFRFQLFETTVGDEQLLTVKLADAQAPKRDRIKAYIAANRGCSTRRIRENVEGRYEEIALEIDALERDGEIENRGSDTRTAWYPVEGAGTHGEQGRNRSGTGRGTEPKVGTQNRGFSGRGSGGAGTPTGVPEPHTGEPRSEPDPALERDLDRHLGGAA